jgi:hypothetical protein
MLAFSFTLHSCFVEITDQMVLRCPSLSFSAASSLIFCALIHWILLLQLGVSPRENKRGVGAVPGAVVLKVFFCPESGESGWPVLGNWTVWFGGRCELVPTSVLVPASPSGNLSCSAATFSRPFSTLGFALSLAASWFLNRGSVLWHSLLVPVTRSYCYLR